MCGEETEMRIKEIHINNFKILKDFTLEFQKSKLINRPCELSVLIGENGTGKTTVFEFIIKYLTGEFNESLSYIKFDLDFLYYLEEILPTNVVVSSYTPFDKLKLKENSIKNSPIPLINVSTDTKDFKSIATRIFNNYISDRNYNIQEILNYIGYTKPTLYFEINEYYFRSAINKAVNYISSKTFDKEKFYNMNLKRNHHSKYSYKAVEKADIRLQEIRSRLNEFNYRGNVNEEDFTLVTDIIINILIITERINFISRVAYHELKSGRKKIINFSNIGELYEGGVQQLKEDLYFMDKLELSNIISDIWLEENYNNELFPVSTLSSGELSLLIRFLDLYEYVEDGSLVLIDEPETHLHPKWIREYVSKIFDIIGGKKCHVIIATHSPLIVSDVPNECIIALKKEQKQVYQEIVKDKTLGMNYDEVLLDIFDVNSSKGKMIDNYIRKVEMLVEKGNIDKALEIYKLIGDSAEKYKLYKKISTYIGDNHV